MTSACLIDFDDSFTFNVVQELEDIGIKTFIKHWSDFKSTPTDSILVLGPGPGHPRDYEKIFPLVLDWLNQERPFLGICLGHQIFWQLQGATIERSHLPLHGQKVELNLDNDWMNFLRLKTNPWVQRYNSLSVKASSTSLREDLIHFVQDNEILMTRGKALMTYQFHPESVGTSFPQAFFRPLLRDFV